MWLTKLISKITKNPEVHPVKLKTIKDLQLMDDIWIKEDEDVYSGWIWDISRRCITVVYGEDLQDFRFQIPRPLTNTIIEQGNKILYCNNPENLEN